MAASCYQEQFKDVLNRLDDLETSAHERQHKIAGHLSITAPHNFAGLANQRRVSDDLKLHPDVTLSWLLVNRHVNLVEEGVDLAIRVGELADSSLVARHYTELNVLFVTSPEYLGKQGQPQHPKELVNHQCQGCKG